MSEFDSIRESAGRRPYDAENCRKHIEQTDDLQVEVDKGSGRWTAMLWFLGVLGTLLVGGVSVLLTKTSDIQTMLNKNDVVLMQHTERINNLAKDIDEIKSRNRYIDQQGSMKTLLDKERVQ